MKKKQKRIVKIIIRFVLLVLAIVAIIFIVRSLKRAISFFQEKENKKSEQVKSSPIPAKAEGKKTAKPKSEEPVQTDEIQDNKITLMFSGDVLFTWNLQERYEKSGVNGIISNDLLQELLAADIYMLNEDFPFSERGEAGANGEYSFRIEKKWASIFQEIGVDIVTLANNHSFDYGKDALTDTIKTLQSMGIGHVGAGMTLEEAKEPLIYTKGEYNIGFLGATRIIPIYDWTAGKDTPGVMTTYDPDILLEGIKEAKKSCDFVVIYVHWGKEKEETPEDYQRDLAKQYIDAGADLVVGSHSAIPQGIEYYKGKPIVYSLGNFMFNSKEFNTMSLKVEIDENKKANLYVLPCKTSNAYMSFLKEKEEFYERIEKLSSGLTINADGLIISK